MRKEECSPLALRKNMQSEKLIMKQIMQLLQFQHWFIFRIPPSLYGHKGLCDLIGVRDITVVFIEVKSPTGSQTMDQKIFQQRIEEAGGAYIVGRSVEDVKGLPMWKRRHVRNSS